MAEITNSVYGYSIGEELLYQVSGRIIFNVKRVRDVSSKVSSLKLRKTMLLLLLYLLENANSRVVSDEEILTEVWDRHGLKGSTHRLWEVMKELKKKLRELGLEDDFILRINSSGYLLKDGVVSPLYYS